MGRWSGKGDYHESHVTVLLHAFTLLLKSCLLVPHLVLVLLRFLLLVCQLSFWYTVYEVKPGAIVDRVIQFWVDLMTPGRGTGERDWWMRALRSLEQTGERTTRELDIRRDLRRWDQDHPEIHHELIVRYLCGALVSVAATSLYSSLRRSSHSRRYN